MQLQGTFPEEFVDQEFMRHICFNLLTSEVQRKNSDRRIVSILTLQNNPLLNVFCQKACTSIIS